MLHLVLGKDWIANRDVVLRRITKDVNSGLGGRILMVPELISHDMERRLCAAAGDQASRYAEVLSFTRLAHRVADSVGSAAEECLDNGGRVVAMAAAARQLHSKLKAYAAVETRPEFLTELVDAVDEFKRCCISAQDLMAASKQTEGSLAQKLEELSLLLEAYDSLCSRGRRDPRDQMSWLLEQLEAGDYAENHVFYIDGFPDFTRQHFAILEHLIRFSPSVTISLNCDRADSVRMAFEKAGATAEELLRSARRADVEADVCYVEEYDSSLQPVRELLFQGRTTLLPGLQGCLQLRRTESVYQECLAAAEQVLRLVRSGARYRQICVVCADMTGYQDPIHLVFRRCGIPLYQAGTEEVLYKSIISALLAAMDAALGGLEQRDVLRYIKSALSPLDGDACDQIENYAILWGIRGSRWQQDWENHPDGLGGEWDASAKARLEELNRQRSLALTPLIRLRTGFQEARTLADQVRVLYAFLEDIQLAQRLGQLAEELDEAGNNREAQILNQLWEILITALEQLYDVLGRTVWDAETFTRLFTLLLSQYDIGTIPPVLDAVMVGPVSAMRCQQTDHLIVLGAVEGSFPGYGGSKGVLTDQERVTLRELGVPLTGGAMDGLQAEFAEIYGVFCGAGKTITVSCPEGQPSYVYRRLLDLAGSETREDQFLGAALADPVEAGAYLTRWNAEDGAKALGVMDSFVEMCRRREYSLGSVTPEHVHGLYGKELNLSASQADSQAECRLSYFLKYGLKAKERKEATVDPAEFGTYVHAVLEQTGRKVMELGGFHQVSLEKTLEMAAEFAAEYAKERFHELDTTRLQYLFQRNNQELELVVRELWQELSVSLFEPVGFEVNFGRGKQMPAVPVGGCRMNAGLQGFVDRVDVWQEQGQNYFRVVDYKTGKKRIDYCDLFNGIGLQMFLYLFALAENGESLLGDNAAPVGVQYFPARVPYVNADTPKEVEKERAEIWKRNSLMLNDEKILSALESEKGIQQLDVKYLASREQLSQFKEYVFRVLGKMVDDIASGQVEPNPYTRGSSHNACNYCPYKAICHPVTVKGRRNYEAMDVKQFWTEIGKELTGHG